MGEQTHNFTDDPEVDAPEMLTGSAAPVEADMVVDDDAAARRAAMTKKAAATRKANAERKAAAIAARQAK